MSGSTICLDDDQADVWPGVDHVGAFVNGNHWIFQPRSGACYGVMVSGLARDAVRNVYERSQVRKIQWP